MELRELLHALHEDVTYSFEDRRYPIRLFYSPFSYWVIMITMDELEQLHDVVGMYVDEWDSLGYVVTGDLFDHPFPRKN